jgi:hypothetical protein
MKYTRIKYPVHSFCYHIIGVKFSPLRCLIFIEKPMKYIQHGFYLLNHFFIFFYTKDSEIESLVICLTNHLSSQSINIDKYQIHFSCYLLLKFKEINFEQGSGSHIPTFDSKLKSIRGPNTWLFNVTISG